MKNSCNFCQLGEQKANRKLRLAFFYFCFRDIFRHSLLTADLNDLIITDSEYAFGLIF